MAPALVRPNARLLSVEDWVDLDEDTAGEFVDGRLVEDEVPTYLHELVVGFLIQHLRSWVIPLGGFVGGSGAKFVLSSSRGRMGDVSLYLPGRRPAARGGVTVPPDIMVEVVSPSPKDARRDRVEKLREYAAFGVRYYWLVDPQLRTFEFLELAPDGRYSVALSAADGLLAEVPGCEGLLLDLDALWREVDALDS